MMAGPFSLNSPVYLTPAKAVVVSGTFLEAAQWAIRETGVCGE